ncbi:uncharacterized protein LOC108004484 [Apis cerana]|uniref:uncharacterized protein LOC108004484 n=1 Tax=Apis cerana TaxID=7461 RepID=UPI002B2295CC|nr:uncharacterized protein LOC108004484 [Apis cerana]
MIKSNRKLFIRKLIQVGKNLQHYSEFVELRRFVHRQSSFHYLTVREAKMVKRHVETVDRAFFGRFPILHHTDMNLTFALTCVMAVIWLFFAKCETEIISNLRRKFRNRPLLREYNVENLLLEEDDFTDLNKRQQFDDYGHLRFGKREQFEDYGHMRFGRSHE